MSTVNHDYYPDCPRSPHRPEDCPGDGIEDHNPAWTEEAELRKALRECLDDAYPYTVSPFGGLNVAVDRLLSDSRFQIVLREKNTE